MNKNRLKAYLRAVLERRDMTPCRVSRLKLEKKEEGKESLALSHTDTHTHYSAVVNVYGRTDMKMSTDPMET